MQRGDDFMSIIDKQLFATEMRERLSDKLTLKDIEIVTYEISQQLSSYDMARRGEEAEQKNFDEMLAMFSETKRLEGRSEKTITRYGYILKRFRSFDKTPIKDVTVFNIRQFLAYEKGRGLKDRTVKGEKEIFCSFFGWLHREGLIQKNPCANLMPIKCKKEIKKPYSEIDIERLKEACKTSRDKAIIAFLLSTGCRISEVCGLNRDDIDFNNLECTVLGKGNKERTVYMNEIAAMQLKNYLSTRKDTNEALFVGKGTDRMHPGGIRKRLNELAAIAGVENVHPHRFRRTLATTLIDHGMPVHEVASILGHDKLDTTMTYVYINQQNVKNSYKKFS